MPVQPHAAMQLNANRCIAGWRMVEELLEEEEGVGWVIAIMGLGHIRIFRIDIPGLLLFVRMTLAAHQPTKEKK
jgi:hypothetical protein